MKNTYEIWYGRYDKHGIPMNTPGKAMRLIIRMLQRRMKHGSIRRCTKSWRPRSISGFFWMPCISCAGFPFLLAAYPASLTSNIQWLEMNNATHVPDFCVAPSDFSSFWHLRLFEQRWATEECLSYWKTP